MLLNAVTELGPLKESFDLQTHQESEKAKSWCMLCHFPIVNFVLSLFSHQRQTAQHATNDNCVNLISERLITGDELRNIW
jgi:hypothetical protein